MMRITALLAVAAIGLAQTTPPSPPGGRGAGSAAGGQTAPATARKAAGAAPLPTYRDLKFPDLRPVEAPRIESVTLSNGMRLYLLENHELPLINGTVLVRTGSLFDPPDKIGLAAIAGQVMMAGGTANRPGEDASGRFQNLGAELGGSIAEDSASISFSALKENADDVLDILKDVLTAPDFPQDRLDLVKAQRRNAIAHRNDDAAAIVRREFVGTVYGKDTPYGAQMEYSNLDRINRSDLVSFYQRYFFPKNMILALDGDFDPARIKARMEALFGDWKPDPPPVPEFPKASTAGAPGKFLAVKRDVNQAYFILGQVGGQYKDADYPALQIAADILGGGQRGRLGQKLRGAVNSLSTTWAASFDHPGVFQISGSLNPFKTTQVIQAIVQELTRIGASLVTEEELKTAKDTALNSLVFAFDNQISMLPRLTQFEYFNYPKDYTQQYQKALESVTRADILRVAKERLDPTRMTLVVVANPTAFEQPLESLGGEVTPLDLTIPPPKPEAISGDPATQRRGRQLLTRAQQAMGGADKLAGVTDYVQEIGYQFDVSAGGAQATMTERWMAPGHLRQDTTLPAGKYSVYSDGKTGWVASAQDSSALAGVQLKQVQGDLFRILFPLLLSDRAAGRKVNSLDDNTVEIGDGAGQIVKLVFDAGTGLLQNVLYDATTENGPAAVIDTYSDYREVGGLKLPYKVTVTLTGKKYQEVTIKSVRLNTGLKLQDLEKRP
jgi:predicted Zn-dependent peptidase